MIPYSKKQRGWQENDFRARGYARIRVVVLRASGAPADEPVGRQAEARLLELAVFALRAADRGRP